MPVTKCPWCGEEVATEEYSDHFQEKHYKGKAGKRTGPYPVQISEKEV